MKTLKLIILNTLDHLMMILGWRVFRFKTIPAFASPDEEDDSYCLICELKRHLK